jgi:hypothetical protein
MLLVLEIAKLRVAEMPPKVERKASIESASEHLLRDDSDDLDDHVLLDGGATSELASTLYWQQWLLPRRTVLKCWKSVCCKVFVQRWRV